MIGSASPAWEVLRWRDFVRGVLKFSLFFAVLIIFIIHQTLIDLIWRNEKAKFRYFMWSISKTAAFGLRILNVEVDVVGVRGEVQKKLIVANHLSYLDVLIMFAHFPSLFVTSVEIRETFLLGRICKLAGCFFVERRKALRDSETKSRELAEMTRQLNNGFNVFLFPEGTSSDGNTVLPFKSTFFQLAIDSKINVLPVALKYLGENSDIPPWYGNMTFADHLMRLCCEKQIMARLIIHEDISGEDRFYLSRATHSIIRESYDKN